MYCRVMAGLWVHILRSVCGWILVACLGNCVTNLGWFE